MLFFKRILNFKKGDVANGDKRQNARYALGANFPAKGSVTLYGRDGDGNPLPKEKLITQDWAGYLVNLSGTGANIQLHPAAVAGRGEPCRLKISLENNHLELEGKIAHFRCYPNYSQCGFSITFPDFMTQKAYLQLLEPVMIGASLAAVPPKQVKQDAKGIAKELYRGESDAQLTVWRDAETRGINNFEFRMNEYFVRGGATSPELEFYTSEDVKDAHKSAYPAPSLASSGHATEIRQLYRWVVPNIAKAVPSDVRRFLERYA